MRAFSLLQAEDQALIQRLAACLGLSVDATWEGLRQDPFATYEAGHFTRLWLQLEQQIAREAG